ncbi:MAG: hypothetical protein L3J56_06690 [Bacteroidales bacterium]|nr:hypothetical protein [Bacteroidales bacterium]
MAKIQISQKEYDKLLKQAEELAELKSLNEQINGSNLAYQEQLQKNESDITGMRNELDKKSKLLEIGNNTIDELKQELSETKETVSQLTKKISELTKENKRLAETEKAYNGMKQSVKVLIAHSK